MQHSGSDGPAAQWDQGQWRPNRPRRSFLEAWVAVAVAAPPRIMFARTRSFSAGADFGEPSTTGTPSLTALR